MAAAGTLSAERLREARAEQVALRPRSGAFSAPHFVEMVEAPVLGDSRVRRAGGS